MNTWNSGVKSIERMKNNQQRGWAHMPVHKMNIIVFFGQNKGEFYMDIFIYCLMVKLGCGRSCCRCSDGAHHAHRFGGRLIRSQQNIWQPPAGLPKRQSSYNRAR